MIKKLILSSFFITNLFIKASDEIKLPNNNENYKLWQTTEHFREGSGISIFKIIRGATLKDYNSLKLEVIDVAEKNDINFIPKYNDTKNLTLIGDVSYKDKPAAGYLKYDPEIQSVVMTIYTSDIHDKFELYKSLQEYVAISNDQIEKITSENRKTPNLKIVNSKNSSEISYKNITIFGDRDDFFNHGYMIIKELKKQGYDVDSLVEDSKRDLICGTLFSKNFKTFYIWYDEIKKETICYIFDDTLVEEDILNKYIDNRFSNINK